MKKHIIGIYITLIVLILSSQTQALAPNLCWQLNYTGTPSWYCVANMTRDVTNNITINITNNITNNITVINNFTTNETKFPIRLNSYTSGSTEVINITLFNGTTYTTNFTDSEGNNNYPTAVDLNNNTATNLSVTISRNGLADIFDSLDLTFLDFRYTLQSVFNSENTSIWTAINSKYDSSNGNSLASNDTNINSKLSSAIINFTNDNTSQYNSLILKVQNGTNVNFTNLTISNFSGVINCDVKANSTNGLLYCGTDATGGGGGNPFNQSLNTSDDVLFNSLNLSTLLVNSDDKNFSVVNGIANVTSAKHHTMSFISGLNGLMIYNNRTINSYSSTNATTWNVSISELGITLPNMTNYSMTCQFFTSAGASGTGEQIGLNVTGGAIINLTYTSLAVGLQNNGVVQGYTFLDTGSAGTNIFSYSFFGGMIQTLVNDTTLNFTLRTEVSGSVARFHAGSNCKYEVMN